MDARVVYERAGVPLLVRRTVPLAVDEPTLTAATAELFARRAATHTGDFSASYLLGVEEDAQRYPASAALIALLRQNVVGPIEAELGVAFDLSFLKLARGRPPTASDGVFYEGPHLDSHPGLAPDRELLRVLINLGSHRRRFRYFLTDVYALEASGVAVGRTAFGPLSLPSDIPGASIDIAGRAADHVELLQFWASVVPHVGINEPPGSFLASFETLAALTRADGRLS